MYRSEVLHFFFLQKLGEPIKNRKIEADIRPTVIEDLARSIQQSYKIIDQYNNNDERYNHIPVSFPGFKMFIFLFFFNCD